MTTDTPVRDCNGHLVPMGIVSVSQIVKPEPQPSDTYERFVPTGHAEYYIDRRLVTKAEHDAAIEAWRSRGR